MTATAILTVVALMLLISLFVALLIVALDIQIEKRRSRRYIYSVKNGLRKL